MRAVFRGSILGLVLVSGAAIAMPWSHSGTSLSSLCQQLKSSARSLRWDLEPCEKINWQSSGQSVQGRPLVFAVFGNANAKNTTLIFSTIHGDEVTPLYLGFKLARWLAENESKLSGTRVVVAPLVNPDGFLNTPRTRMNARGVDLNRNFATKDWNTTALKAWKTKYHSDPRRFPGAKPQSEPETSFQDDLIRRFHPQKIMAIHSPLNFMDYDGPTALSLARFPREYVQVCLRLRSRLKAITSGYFPGSLGNYAGQERGIPTMTLELPTSDAKRADQYWKLFQSGIKTMIEYKVPDYASSQIQRSGG